MENISINNEQGKKMNCLIFESIWFIFVGKTVEVEGERDDDVANSARETEDDHQKEQSIVEDSNNSISNVLENVHLTVEDDTNTLTQQIG